VQNFYKDGISLQGIRFQAGVKGGQIDSYYLFDPVSPVSEIAHNFSWTGYWQNVTQSKDFEDSGLGVR